MLHFIDYLPEPVYILILLVAIIIMIKYFILNKKYILQEKIGIIIMILGGIVIIIDKLSDTELSVYLPLVTLMAYFILIGFLIFSGGIVRRVKDPEQKRQLRKYFIFFCISFSIIGILLLYTIIVKGY